MSQSDTELPESVSTSSPPLSIRQAVAGDYQRIVDLDAETSSVSKPDYWREIFALYVSGEDAQRYLLVADLAGKTVGFALGEVRAWEFGSPPAGWIFAIGVDPESRQIGIGTHLFKAISKEIRASGVKVVRTMLARDDNLNMSFFRSHGMTGGSFIQLEMPLDQNGDETEAERAEAT